MKLWIDDIRNAPDDSWLVARTIGAAIRAIARTDFDEISLDHDISHQVGMGARSRPYPCEETFQSVAYFIGMKANTNLGTLPPKKITLHTSNPIGAQEMKKILEEYGIKSEIKMMGAANRLEMNI